MNHNSWTIFIRYRCLIIQKFTRRNKKKINWNKFVKRFLMCFDDSNWKQNSLIAYNFIRQIDEYNKIDDYCVRFQKMYENIREKTNFFVTRQKFINDFKIVIVKKCNVYASSIEFKNFNQHLKFDARWKSRVFFSFVFQFN